ncbi:MAG TPA: patatin-like phospholipase family protein [Tissierellales bacterium]|nr:patatin-like phospholipase family protein [Tissierellales bacterium]
MQGLVLEGGGAKGAYHIGAYKAIKEMNIEINGIAGTSVGALNGAMIIQNDFEKAYDLWNNVSYSTVIDAEDEEIEKFKKRKFNVEDMKKWKKKAKTVFGEKGFDITPLKDLLKEVIDEEKIRNSDKDFGMVTVSLTDLEPLEIYIEDIPKGMLKEYLLASSYLPVFKTEKLDGKVFLDGGVYNNLPIDMLAKKGYKDIIAVKTSGMGRIRKSEYNDLNLTFISPNEDLGKTLEFEKEIARRDLKLGYYDGLKALKGLRGYKYYIEGKNDEEYFINKFLALGEEKILQIGNIFGIEGIPYRRLLFEHIVPKVSSIVGTGKESDYEDIVISFLEFLGEKYEVEQFKVYNYDEFLNIIKENHIKREKEEDLWRKLVNKVELLSMFNKEEIIKNIGDIMF